jgi:UrcA family protein
MSTTNTRPERKAHYGYGLLTSLAAICLTLSATSVRAADETPGYAPAKTVVQYGDLNLANPEGVKRLYNRIVAASKGVCDSKDRSLSVQAHDRICMQRSIARAVKAVDRPELTAFYSARTGQPIARLAEVTAR